MGQILGIGIVTRCSTSKKYLQEYKITKDELIAEMVIKKHFDPTIYDFSETEERYIFDLKPKVLENQLIPFLEKFYPLVYIDKNVNYDDTIELLKKTDPSKWLELADEKNSEEFQTDEYGVSEYLYFDKSFKPCAKISSDTILLSMEGKIGMEVYGRQFNFFKYCMQVAFSEFSIAKALRVYISG